jgi:hypothetical protein
MTEEQIQAYLKKKQKKKE